MTGNDLEYAPLVGQVSDALREKNADLVDIMRRFSPKITELRDAATAAELDRHSAELWEAAKWLESTYEVLNGNGDEQAAAIVQGQLKVLQDVSGKLSRRAATVRGVSAEELAARAILTAPADVMNPEPAPPSAITPTLDDGGIVFGVDPAGAEAFTASAISMAHAVCGKMAVVADFDEALAWRNDHLPKCPGPPKADEVTP